MFYNKKVIKTELYSNQCLFFKKITSDLGLKGHTMYASVRVFPDDFKIILQTILITQFSARLVLEELSFTLQFVAVIIQTH